MSLELSNNPYRSPFLSDNELLLRAEYLSRDLHRANDRIEYLQENRGDLDKILELCCHCDAVSKELGLVLEALEENSYDVSWYNTI
ncbi:hypothetical protein [Vibrio lentus]|uniref:hypothetical protein n=1 Tax=Vibrio lentus TaxID=136468 RepID=UPI000C846C41|nr:hypothetical protein [Vibrio lentus]PMJ83582.1 hypothetical protein BCU14_13190 [Vibrio lentus]PMN41313.1 hypothetical protein BCT33_14365 [Vibrio lentus]PMN60261.1 hypothetical protein BCT29_23320 [Vibrio lentus]